MQFLIISKIISKLFKTKNDITSQKDKINDNFENNFKTSPTKFLSKGIIKESLFNKLKIKFGKYFNIYLMNSKIIDNEDESHCKKIRFFLREIILFFFIIFFENFKEKIDLNLPKEIISIIIEVLQEYEIDCEETISDLQKLCEKMNYIIFEEDEKMKGFSQKINLKSRISTNKKLRKTILSKKRTRTTKLKKLEKGANKLEKYFKISSINQEIKNNKFENSNMNNCNKLISNEKNNPYIFNKSNPNIKLSKGSYSKIFENEICFEESYLSNQALSYNRINSGFISVINS